MANALLDVQNTFTTLNANYNMLRAACQTDQQRTDLAAQYEAAETAYNKCVNKMLADDDAAVATLSTELKAANEQIVKSVQQMGNMSKVIDDITTAVTTGAKLAAMAGL
jgi:hypothetical protein